MTELNNISKIDFGNNVVLTQNNITKNKKGKKQKQSHKITCLSYFINQL